MVAVPLTVPRGIEPEAGPAAGHGQHEVHVPAGLHVVGHTGDHLHHAEGAVGGGQRARARRGDRVDRSSALSAASKDSTHSGER